MHAVRQDNPNAGRRLRKVADDSMALARRIMEPVVHNVPTPVPVAQQPSRVTL
jgi:hypothetical protein